MAITIQFRLRASVYIEGKFCVWSVVLIECRARTPLTAFPQLKAPMKTVTSTPLVALELMADRARKPGALMLHVGGDADAQPALVGETEFRASPAFSWKARCRPRWQAHCRRLAAGR
jgi:hypothetical protein